MKTACQSLKCTVNCFVFLHGQSSSSNADVWYSWSDSSNPDLSLLRGARATPEAEWGAPGEPQPRNSETGTTHCPQTSQLSSSQREASL